ncbi:MAG: AIM24 family protein [Ilumatobacteraceae bacterium]
MSMLPPPTLDAPPSNSYTCPYCRLDGPSTGTSCTHCGAPVDIRASVSQSGWERQPAIKDLARIQFGQSTCQVSGVYVPAAELRLGAGEGVYFGHHQLLWSDTVVQLSNQPLKGAWNRKMAGLDLVMMQAVGPGSLALADNTPGETIVVPLIPGRSVDVREHRFVMASLNVTYDWFQSGVWYRTTDGDDTETHYPAGMFIDRFAATGTPGMLMLHGHGNVFVRDLAPGQSILMHPGAFLWKDSAVGMTMHLERPASGGWFGRWSPSTPWMRLTGPGRIAVSSKYERMESTGRVSSTSPCTTMDWNQQRQMAQIGAVQTAFSASKIDDAPFEAALDAFANSNGFTPGADKNRGIVVAHQYTHPAGIAVSCAVSDKSGIAAIANSALGGLGGALSKNTAVSGRLNKLMGSLSQAPTADGDPVEGFGFPATWKVTAQGKGVLTVIKNNRSFAVTIECAQMSPQDQYAWARAFAMAGLPAI